MKLRVELIALSTIALLATAGCTPEARQDVGQAGSNIEQATEKSVQGTAEAADRAGDKIAAGAQEAARETAVAADRAGDQIAEGAKEVGAATQKAASNAAEAVGGTVKGVGKEVQDAGQSASLTPKIKNALIQSSIDASTIDVDTSGEKDTVFLKGTIPSAAKKQQAEQVARKALKEAGSTFKLVNQLQVSGGGKM